MPTPVRVVIDGRSYPSLRAASRATGRARATIVQMCGHQPDALLRVEAMPVRVRGTVYPSARAAAAALGVTLKTVYNAISLGREDRVGLPREIGHPVVFCGCAFPSMRAASLAFGLQPVAVWQAHRKGRLAQLEARVRAAAEGRRDAA